MPEYAEYDAATDRLYVHLIDAAVVRTETLDDRRSIDYAADGRIVGIAISHPFAGGISLRDIPLAPLVGSLILQTGHKFRLVE